MSGEVMRELALFAGAGGGILGGSLLGWRTICAVERDPYAAGVLIARQNDGSLPPFPVWDDVSTFDGRPWRGAVDVISGGFPCQDISIAGKGAGITGERSGLWKEMARIIGRFDRDTCSWKTHRCLFTEDLSPSSVTLPRWGMIRGGECWELVTSGHRISGKGSGLWPTPVADGDRTTNYAQGETSLGYAARNWPTPRASDHKGARTATETTERRVKNGQANLPEAVMESRKMWQTPTVQDSKNNGAPSQMVRHTKPLNVEIGGALNPMWVEWLMGWPLGWTNYEPLETDKYRAWQRSHGPNCDDSAMIPQGPK